MLANDEYQTENMPESQSVFNLDDDDAEYEKRERLCIACRKRERDCGENSHSSLCDECRAHYLKLRVPLKIKLFLLLVCGIFLLSLIMFQTVLSDYRVFLAAGKHFEAKEYCHAYNDYSAVLEKYPDSAPIILKTAEAAMRAQYLVELADTFDKYLVGKELDDGDYAKAMEYSDLLDSYFGTANEIDGIITEIDGISATKDEAELLQMLRSKLEALLTKEGIDKTLVYFYLGNCAGDQAAAAEYLRLATEQDARYTYPYSYYGTLLRRTGEFDRAEQVYLRALERNADDAFSMRGMGVLQLLNGQKEAALETMRQAYAIEPYGLYIPESMVIALCENGLRDEAMALLEQLGKNGYQVEEDLQDYLEGRVDLRTHYLGEEE